MNRSVCDSRQLGLCPLLIASLLCLTAATTGASAQHFYDHDRQWAHGTKTDNGLVPDDYLVPMPAGEITRSTPPFGYRVRKSQAAAMQAPVAADDTIIWTPAGGGRYEGYTASGRRVSPGHTSTARGGKPHNDEMDWLNGMGGSGYGSMTVTASDRLKQKAAQAAAARRQQDMARKQQQDIYARAAVDSGGLLHGIGELK